MRPRNMRWLPTSENGQMCMAAKGLDMIATKGQLPSTNHCGVCGETLPGSLVCPKCNEQNISPNPTCDQCGAPQSELERLVLGPVCGKCCRANHKRVMG